MGTSCFNIGWNIWWGLSYYDWWWQEPSNATREYVKTGEPLYKKADHLTKEELETSGKFTTEEITKILWSDFIEGYQRDPEKGEAEERKKKRERKGGYDEKRERRMNDPKTGINSPAFAEFMRSRGMWINILWWFGEL